MRNTNAGNISLPLNRALAIAIRWQTTLIIRVYGRNGDLMALIRMESSELRNIIPMPLPIPTAELMAIFIMRIMWRIVDFRHKFQML
jgi:hypothetical protein